MIESSNQPIEYERAQCRSGAPRLLRVGALAGVAADLAILAAIFIWNGGRIWGPYLHPPMTVSWAQPVATVSLFFGLVAVFASGVGIMRSGPMTWKVVAALASSGYLIGVVCVVMFGLL